MDELEFDDVLRPEDEEPEGLEYRFRLEPTESLASVHAKLDELLTPADRTALEKLSETGAAIVPNLVSSAIWQFTLLPFIQTFA